MAAILLPLVLVPQWLSKQARWDALRSHVAEIGQLAATVVDGDLHRQLVDPANYSDDLYARARAPRPPPLRRSKHLLPVHDGGSRRRPLFRDRYGKVTRLAHEP